MVEGRSTVGWEHKARLSTLWLACRVSRTDEYAMTFAPLMYEVPLYLENGV